MVLVTLLVLAIGATLFTWQRSRPNPTVGALGILEERYTKGEIDKKEFDEKRKDLK